MSNVSRQIGKNLEDKYSSEISDSHGEEYEDCSLLGYCAV
jgi:hypothetical protein